MITIHHNLLHNNFRKISVSPKEDCIPYYTFRKSNGDNDDVITRTLDLSRFDESKEINILASKVIETGGKAYVRYYKFHVLEKESKTGSYSDEYVQIRTTDGDVVCQEASKFINVEEVRDLIIAKGQENTQKWHDKMAEINSNTLYKGVYREFLKSVYAEMEFDEKFKIFFCSFDKIDIIQLYAEGIRQYLETSGIGIVNNTQRLMDEVQIQMELYNISNTDRYINNCRLFLQQCPDTQILDDAYALWDKGGEFDFLWDTSHLDCRFSVGLEDTSWHMWVGINHHSSDDETYTIGVGGEAIDEECTFANTFFEEMHWHIIERGRK